MPRTTLDIDASVLRDLRARRAREGKSLGTIVSELLAEQLGAEGTESSTSGSFTWNSRAMKPRVDLEDKDAVYAALERE